MKPFYFDQTTLKLLDKNEGSDTFISELFTVYGCLQFHKRFTAEEKDNK